MLSTDALLRLKGVCSDPSPTDKPATGGQDQDQQIMDNS